MLILVIAPITLHHHQYAARQDFNFTSIIVFIVASDDGLHIRGTDLKVNIIHILQYPTSCSRRNPPKCFEDFQYTIKLKLKRRILSTKFENKGLRCKIFPPIIFFKLTISISMIITMLSDKYSTPTFLFSLLGGKKRNQLLFTLIICLSYMFVYVNRCLLSQ